MKHMRSIFLLFIFVAAVLAACADGGGQVNETPGIGTDIIGTDTGLGGTNEALSTSTTTGGTTGTEVATSQATATRQVTSTAAVATTEAVEGTATTTTGQATKVGTSAAGAPQGVNDDTDPSRISNLLDFRVVLQGGEDVGEVDDLVLDFTQQHVVYLVVGAGGVLGIGEKDLLIPWDAIELPIGRGSDTNDTEDDKVISLVAGVTQDTIDNTPDFDLDSDFPVVGTVDNSWDTDLSSYWAEFTGIVGGVATQASGTETSGTPAAGTTTPKTTSTVTAGSTKTAGTGTGLTEGVDKMGVALATDVLGYDFRIGTEGDITTGGDTPVSGTTVASTPEAGGTDMATDTYTDDVVGSETANATIDDVIIDVATGQMLYFVIRTDLGSGDDRLIPVAVDAIKWDGQNNAFVLDISAADLQNAPSFEDGTYPNITMKGWDDQFKAFWADFINSLP